MKIACFTVLFLPLLTTGCRKSGHVSELQTVSEVVMPSRDLLIPAELLRFCEDANTGNARTDEPVSKIAEIDSDGMVDVTKLSGKLGKGTLVLLPSVDSKAVDQRWKSIPLKEGQPLSIEVSRDKQIALGCIGSNMGDLMERKMKGVSNFYEVMACPIPSNESDSVCLFQMAGFQFKP